MYHERFIPLVAAHVLQITKPEDTVISVDFLAYAVRQDPAMSGMSPRKIRNIVSRSIHALGFKRSSPSLKAPNAVYYINRASVQLAVAGRGIGGIPGDRSDNNLDGAQSGGCRA
jgi:hypothetical protein